MSILRAQSVLAIGAAGAVVCALASGQVACSSSTSGGGTGSSSGSSSGGGEEGGTDSGSSSGSSSGGSSGSSSGSTGEGGTEPTIAFVSPTNGAMVTPTGATAAVPITFSVTNFMLVAPMTASCSNTSDNCGHVHVLVDGMACNASGQPYNNAATSTSTEADLSLCPMGAGGMHKITLELHHNDHTPVQVGGMTVSDSVMITASGGGGDAGGD